MRTDDFDYHLPPELIAQRPRPRGTSRLLVLDEPPGSDARHRTVSDLPSLLTAGDLLVVNDTRVIPARLYGRRRDTGGRVELLLLERVAAGEWECLARPGKRLRPGVEVALLRDPERDAVDEAEVVAQVVASGDEGKRRLRFRLAGSGEHDPMIDDLRDPRVDESTLAAALERLGHVPLPPYIERPDEAEDRERYQTVYAANPGAVAAPTAGLHFDRPLLDRLAATGIGMAAITLHVGLGTFRPVTAERVDEHRMDRERYSIPEETAAAIEATRRAGGTIVAVGTTVVRCLEAAARAAQAEPGAVATGPGATDLFITPGYRFQVVDRLLTNFHLPRSTLLMLVSALAGRERVLAAYEEAVERGYRFYSYGDAMLVGRRECPAC